MADNPSAESHPVAALIRQADRLITAEDFGRLLAIYDEDATLVVKPGLVVSGRARIRQAFEAIADHFEHRLTVTQGAMEIIEGSDTALVVMETLLEIPHGDGGALIPVRRKATYVFRRSADGQWLCTVDNSYGTDILEEVSEAL
ncbi:YybH family protein [Salinicola socius]|uniref:DUF4440 domain-containing protein n=1 Tax=Salinicola socius TaxID=404433 RepID=A0A1Q8SS75_9GAMM|nr:DUF4440 domain-containing protein [Salinicola socius]OLO04295.1 DUF4440 domain-containing protein [Salinicola socius]